MNRNLWHVIKDDKPEENTKGKSEESASTKLKEWNISNWRAQSLIWVSLADNIQVNVTSKNMAEDLWTKLENPYQDK